MDKLQKLSQAIRLGATFRPQCKRALFAFNRDGVLSSCAVGAAFEAITGETHQSPHVAAAEVISQRLPNVERAIFQQILVWNDADGLTREQIADKLEAEGL